MIRQSALADAAAALHHASTGKTAVAKEQAALIGVSVPTLYRQLKKAGLYGATRKRRADRGEVRVDGIDDAKIMEVAALMFTSKRNQGRIIMPADVAIEIAESNGLIPKGVLQPSTLNRHLRRLEADKRAMLAEESHIKTRSLHPNHYHQLDYSVCVQWYLDKKGMGERDMVGQVLGQSQAAVSFIDTGRALIKLKEQLPHGEFRSGLEYRGIPKSTANDMMRVARKMSWRSDKFIKLGRAKLYACMELDDDEIDALEDGGSILDITLDDMDRMTTRELKDALKKSRADSDVKDRLLQSKNKQIDDVAEENARLHGHVSEQGVSAFIQEIESEKAQILIPLMRLKNRSLAMEQQLNSEGAVDRAEYFALQAALDCVRDELAQAMDAIYNAGAEFQASVSQASMPSESGNIQ